MTTLFLFTFVLVSATAEGHVELNDAVLCSASHIADHQSSTHYSKESQSSAPDSEEPQSSAPYSEAPQSSAPDSEEPQSSAPDSEEPQSSAPDSEEPQSSAPDSEEPQSSAPDSEESQSSAFDSEEPQSSASDSEEPQSSAPYSLEPGDLATPFSVPTLDGRFIFEPGLFCGSLFVLAFTNRSGFLESLWGSPEALAPLVHGLPRSAQVLFLSLDDDALQDVLWMREQLQRVANSSGSIPLHSQDVLSRLHFCPVPVFALGNWIPALLYSWGCVTPGCGLHQAVFTSREWKTPVIVKRLDARYDWLTTRWGQRSYRLVDAGDGCAPSAGLVGAVAWVSGRGCSSFTKVQMMAQSEASGVLVWSGPGEPLRDLTCEGPQCDRPALKVRAATVHPEPSVTEALRLGRSVNVSFQATPSPKFFFCIDQQGALAELGGLLYPSLSFINWQAQWFDFRSGLLTKLQSPASVLSVFEKARMLGRRGARAAVRLPPGALSSDRLELDMSLSCPSPRDVSCALWDRTVQLFVCCDPLSVHCGVELGRWITAFRRGIGHWLTDVSPLLPVLDGPVCSFTMRTDPWAMPWVVSLRLRFSQVSGAFPAGGAPLRPFKVLSLHRGGTFDQNYNQRHRTLRFTAPASTRRVELLTVVTAHGSDERSCGEFCVTSHHFTVNSRFNNSLTFSAAGSPLGCTLKVPEGAVPNEYGTWLYGRGGWCDGLQVDPWRVDLTEQVDLSGWNSVQYRGLFQDRDPGPSSEPGYIIMSSFLVFYSRAPPQHLHNQRLETRDETGLSNDV